MVSRRRSIAILSFVGVASRQSRAWAQDLHLIESKPAAHSIVSGDSTEFFVRFDRPVDHIHSLLQIQRGNELVDTLHPRLRSAPQVLFARTPTLPAGDYNLHWEVIGMSEKESAKGDIPFTVRQ